MTWKEPAMIDIILLWNFEDNPDGDPP